jgi:hypothetical protein
VTYDRCQCGKIEVWSSGEVVPRCSPCKACGTVPARGPSSHPDPEPHEFVARDVATDAGPQPLSRCRWCHRTKAEIEREDVEEVAP